MGVLTEDFEAIPAAGELPGLVGDDEVEPFDFAQDRLGGEGGGIGGGEGEEGVLRLRVSAALDTRSG